MIKINKELFTNNIIKMKFSRDPTTISLHSVFQEENTAKKSTHYNKGSSLRLNCKKVEKSKLKTQILRVQKRNLNLNLTSYKHKNSKSNAQEAIIRVVDLCLFDNDLSLII